MEVSTNAGPYTGRTRNGTVGREQPPILEREQKKKRKTKEGGGDEKEMKEENKRNLGTTSSKVGVEGYAD